MICLRLFILIFLYVLEVQKNRLFSCNYNPALYEFSFFDKKIYWFKDKMVNFFSI